MNHYHPNDNLPAPVRTLSAAPARSNGDLADFKRGVDDLLEKRQYFIQQVLPLLKEGLDFFVIKGKKSLGKAGAEKLASIWSITAKFEKDRETLEMIGDAPGLVAYRCDLYRNDAFAGQGRGADALNRNQNDANKTVKMAQKRAFVDAIIRSTGLSDIFTQDLEDAPDPAPDTHTAHIPGTPALNASGTPATDRQKQLLDRLIDEKYGDDGAKREELRARLRLLTKRGASNIIAGLLSGATWV